MDFKIPEVFGFRLNFAISKILKSQIAISRFSANGKMNSLFLQTEKLDITICDIRLLVDIFHFFSTKNNRAESRFKNLRHPIVTSNLASQYADNPVI